MNARCSVAIFYESFLALDSTTPCRIKRQASMSPPVRVILRKPSISRGFMTTAERLNSAFLGKSPGSGVEFLSVYPSGDPLAMDGRSSGHGCRRRSDASPGPIDPSPGTDWSLTRRPGRRRVAHDGSTGIAVVGGYRNRVVAMSRRVMSQTRQGWWTCSVQAMPWTDRPNCACFARAVRCKAAALPSWTGQGSTGLGTACSISRLPNCRAAKGTRSSPG